MPSIDSNEVDLSNVESVRRSEVFPKKCLKIINSKGDFELQESSVNDGNDGSVADERKSEKDVDALPFDLLAGEYVDYSSRLCYSNEDTIYCTNYRLIIVYDKPIGFYNIPIRSIDCVDLKEMINLHVFSKDGKFLRLCFENNAICLAWYRLLSSFIPGPQKLDSLFAFTFNAWSNDDENFSLTFGDNLGLKSLDFYTCAKNAKNFHLKFGKKIPRNFAAKIEFDSLRTCKVEFERLAFDNSKWKIVDLNREYKFCPTYPRYFILPASISDAHIEKMATFRSMKRVPTAVWRHRSNGAVLLRSSQPETGLLGWRNEADESVLNEVSKAAFNFATTNRGNSLSEESNTRNDANAKTMLILDARSYGAAWANRAKGGGYENIVYYPNCDIEFLGMSNIHAVRYSFQQLRTLCWESCTTANGAGSSQNSESSSSAWLQALDSTQWIAYLHILLASALKVVETLHYQAKCVLVHCSDGWDRTTQIISLAKLMLDPYYRTMAGFKELIEREWIAFGHKFGERTGLLAGDTSQRAPIFLQWLDCVRHIHKANPCSFEFNEIYLVKLAQHVYSGLFGNFLCNSAHEHITNNVSSRTFSIWSFLHPMNDQFKNILFVDPTKDTDMKTRNVLTTPYKVRDLTDLWQLLHCPQNADPAIKRQTNLMTLSTTSLESSATLSDDSDHTVMALSIASLLNNNNFSNLSTSSIMNEDQTDNNDFSISYKEITSDSDFYGVENSSFCPFLGKDEKETAIGEESSVVNAIISRLIVDVSTKITVEDASRENSDIDSEISPADALRAQPGDEIPYFSPSTMSLAQTEDETDDGYDSKAPTITPSESLPTTCAVLKNDASTSTSDLPENFSKSLSEADNLSSNVSLNEEKNIRRTVSFSGCSASYGDSGASCSQNDTLTVSEITLKREKSRNRRSRKLNLRKLIDIDGLTKISLIHQEKMSKIINDYEQQLDRMNAELDEMKRLFYDRFSARSRNQSFTKNNERLISESSSDALELPVPLEKSMAVLSDASWEDVNEASGGGSFNFNFSDNNAATVACSGDSVENLDDLVENLDESNDFSCLMSTKTRTKSHRQRTSSCNSDFPQRPVSRCSACGMEFCPPKINNCRHCGKLSCDSCSQIGQNGTNHCRECNWQAGSSENYEATKLCA